MKSSDFTSATAPALSVRVFVPFGPKAPRRFSFRGAPVAMKAPGAPCLMSLMAKSFGIGHQLGVLYTRVSFLVGLEKWMAIPGLFGGSIIRDIHLFPLKEHLWLYRSVGILCAFKGSQRKWPPPMLTRANG